MAGLKAARDAGKVGGRPSSLKPEDVMTAYAMLSNKKITVKEVARRLKIDVSTLYRHLPGGRGGVLEAKPT